MRFPRREYWSGLPFPSPGDIPYPGIQPESPALTPESPLYHRATTEAPTYARGLIHFFQHQYHVQDNKCDDDYHFIVYGGL